MKEYENIIYKHVQEYIPFSIDSRILFQVVVGSRGYGCYTDDSDFDIIIVLMPPKKYLIGLEKFNYSRISFTNEEDGIKFDISTYSFGHFMDRCVKGSVKENEALFKICNYIRIEQFNSYIKDIAKENNLEEEDYDWLLKKFDGIHHNKYFTDCKVFSNQLEKIADNLHLFYTKRFYNSCFGYAKSMARKLKNWNLDKNKEYYKIAMHLYRLIMSCCDIYSYDYSFFRDKDQREDMNSIRKGVWRKEKTDGLCYILDKLEEMFKDRINDRFCKIAIDEINNLYVDIITEHLYNEKVDSEV